MNPKSGTRSLMYVLGVLALTLATVLTLAVITQAQVEQWVENLMFAVAILAQVYGILTNLLAKKNVTPDQD